MQCPQLIGGQVVEGTLLSMCVSRTYVIHRRWDAEDESIYICMQPKALFCKEEI